MASPLAKAEGSRSSQPDSSNLERRASSSTTGVCREHLEQKFEEDFSQHLQKKNRMQSYALGAVGAGIGGAIGVAASPLLLPGLAVAAIVGGAGGYQWAKRLGRQELQRNRASGEAAEVDAQQGNPTLRRLRYLVKWGHWQLVEYEDASAESRCAVLDEVIRAFSPWVQRMYLLRAKGPISEADADSREVLVHLAPLYFFLQRRAASEAIVVAAAAVAEAFDGGAIDALCQERCRVIFPTVLESISTLDRLGPATHAQLLREVAVVQNSDQRTNRRPRLKRIVETVMKVLERADVKQALADPRPFEQRTTSFAESSGDAAREVPPSPTSSSSSKGREPFVPPPEGVEDEPGGGDDDEYYSASGGSDDEVGKAQPKAARPPLPRSPSRSTSGPTGAGIARIKSRIEAFPRGEVDHSWRPFDASTYDLRSETYLKDRKKAPSAPPLLELLHCDFLLTPPSGAVMQVGDHKDFFAEHNRQSGDNRFLFILNFLFPPYQCVITSAVDPNAEWYKEDSPQGRLWRKFVNSDEDAQRDILKMIASVEEGPWMVKRAAPRKPCLIGRKVKTKIITTSQYVEVVFDLLTGRAEQLATKAVCGALTRVEISLGILLEGRDESELPETLLVCPACKHVDPRMFLMPDA